MQRLLALPILFCLVLLGLGLAACGPDEEVLAAEARVEAWSNLEQVHTELTEMRAKYDELTAQIESGAEALEIDESSEQTPEEALAALQQEVDALEEQVLKASESFMGDLVNYINEEPMVQGEEPSEQQMAALRMKSAEDLLVAVEYANEGGDWKRAASIIERALTVDPDNSELKEKLVWAQEMRFVTEERFGQVEEGMTQEQVRAVLGQVKLNNIRDFDDSRVGWFYPKNPEDHGAGSAAGVYFQKKKGEWSAYKADFNAIEAQDS